jgi:ABC-2 type transport system ATP-binding protein
VQGVHGVAQVGNALRVLIDAKDTADTRRRIDAALANAGASAAVAEVPPNLEDVFVAATRGHARTERAA